MAAAGVMDHDVAGSFASRISSVNAESAAENIAMGAKTWNETFSMWQASAGHNANLLRARADSVGVAFARNENTKYKTYWAMVIAEKSPNNEKSANKKRAAIAVHENTGEARAQSGTIPNPVDSLKRFVCKYVC